MSKVAAVASGDRTVNVSDLRSCEPNNIITSLPREILGHILEQVARLDYDSLYSLCGVSVLFRDLCQDFMKKNPRNKFKKPVAGRPAGQSDSEDSDYDKWDDVNEVRHSDDDEALLEQLSQFSFGSNLDEGQLDDYLNRSSPESEVGEAAAAAPPAAESNPNWADDQW